MNKQVLQNHLAEAQKLGIPFSEKTQDAIAELENPHYTITLSGEFQVGKSTLLNKVLLGTNVLLTEGEGKGLATTAIPCKIVHAPTKELTVIYREEGKAPARYFGDTVTPDLLRSLTTAQGEDARLALSKEIRHVVLGLPLEALNTYTFFDTPGVNDPNTELIERTTAETLPQSDIVLLVVDASKTLTSETLGYLKKSVFSEGMTRVLVLASYKPQVYLSAENRQSILDTIRAQLGAIGRGYVPVISYTYDSDVDGDILRGPQEILSAILQYLAENREVSKIDRLAYCLVGDAVSHAESLKAKIEVSGKGEAEIVELERKIDAEARKLDAQYNTTLNEFSTEFSRIQANTAEKLKFELLDKDNANSALNAFMAQFKEITDLVAVRNQVEPAVKTVAPIVQEKLAENASDFVSKLRSALQRASDSASAIAQQISISTEFEPSVSGGWVGKLNPTLVKALEVGGVALALGPVYGAIVYFLDRIPAIKAFVPHNLLGNMVKTALHDSFKDSLNVALQGQLGQMEDASDVSKRAIKDVFADIYRERVAPYQDAIRAGSEKILSEEEIAATKSAILSIDSFTAALAQ